MNIDRAKALSNGDVVHFPEDRGDPAGSGVVQSTSTTVNKNIHDVEYIWVYIRVNGRQATWPSNRLG